MDREIPIPLYEHWRPTREQVDKLLSIPGMPDRKALSIEFLLFQLYWMHGKGSGTRRTHKGWSQCFANWCMNQVKFAKKESRANMSAYRGRVNVR